MTAAARRGRPGADAAPVTYGAIGATQAPDLLQYPPRGFKPVERSIRLGSGEERWQTSRSALLSWGVQRGAGLEVRDIDLGTGEQYAGIRYNDDGTPAGMREVGRAEDVYDESGEPQISNGMSAVLRMHLGPFTVDAPVRVVYVVEDENRVGFAYGTLAGHPESGEEAFMLERRADDSVWLTVRAFSRPASFGWRLLSPVLRQVQKNMTAKYLRALHPISAA
ncbi:DUF1990 family protein [Gryllotalpicola ginsengisoli]|uniref:DUF1990 family protein n=1 Tax=Gryllotalpicola ginsengisoli TaxID=444608 RepID=UPI0003B2F6AB|nr:DUF1990 domain-containing protein [Gryllotalpicola ginsengisoli]